MSELAAINGQDIAVKEYQGQRVVTFKDIDQVHNRSDGTARKRFYENKERFIEGTDFFRIMPGDKPDNALSVFRTVGIPPMGITLLTETGYLMLVKSFTDNLAWKVQRELVRNYFNTATPSALKENRISGDEVKRRVFRYNTTLEVLSELYCSLSHPDFLVPIADTMRIIAFDMSSFTCDLKRSVKQETVYE